MANKTEDRIQEEAKSLQRITNADLKCKDCFFRLDDSVRLGNTSQCKQYPLKPNEVLKGGGCPRYRKE